MFDESRLGSPNSDMITGNEKLEVSLIMLLSCNHKIEMNFVSSIN